MRALLLALALVGCEPEGKPLVPGARPNSMYGYLAKDCMLASCPAGTIPTFDHNRVPECMCVPGAFIGDGK